eukprot:gene42188-57123_t
MNKPSVYENTNGVPTSNGKNLHMEVGRGQLANRIITVGAESRAILISSLLDNEPSPNIIRSSRGFTTITGSYKGTSISIVSIGMGPSMMDFFVRESRAIVEGPMAIVRFGTCGGISHDAVEGTVVISSEGSGYVVRNPDYFSYNYSASGSKSNTMEPYTTYNIAPADEDLSASVAAQLRTAIDPSRVASGLNVTAESFYSSQGRIDDAFDDSNMDVLTTICTRYPSAKTLEMESFMLLHLAKCCTIPMHATAAAIVVANRKSSRVVDEDSLKNLESKGGL